MKTFPLFILLSFSILDLICTSEPPQKRVKRQFYTYARKWPNNQVNYQFEVIDEERKAVFRQAMKYISDRTCIKYKEDANAFEQLFIRARGMGSCSAYAGAPGNPGREWIYFGGCATKGLAVHELSHSLGVMHEHQRPDRDSFLHVNKTAANKFGVLHDIVREPWNETGIYSPFDYGSIMMYRVDSVPEEILRPTNGKYRYTMGNERIGFYDMMTINRHYNCKCNVNLPCLNGGYTNPAACSKCLCPPGFLGAFCGQKLSGNSQYDLTAFPYWQSRTYSFNSPGRFTNLSDYRSTFVYITAPVGRKIEILLETLKNSDCWYGCLLNGVEIKTNTDTRSISPIVCCPEKQEFAKQVFRSTNNPTIIEMYSRKPEITTAVFRFRAV